MFWFSKIGRMVMAVITEKIKAAQAEYLQRCQELEAQHKEEVRRLKEVKEQSKVTHAQKLVEGIVGKLV
jgi:hypothetical protein